VLQGSASAKDADLGLIEYKSKCAICHGYDGKGDGPFAKQLTTRPSDLTLLAKNNGGVLPDNILEKIDGRKDVEAHGPRDMPVWGNRPVRAGDFGQKTRMEALINYLSRIQVKNAK
jgi:mono/diheme cytochrome c family protein